MSLAQSQLRAVTEGWHPGRGFAAMFVILSAIQIYFLTLPSGSLVELLVLLVWAVLAIFLVVSFIGYLISTPIGHWRNIWRWPLIAAAIIALVGLAFSGVALRVRFEISRPAFEQLATNPPVNEGAVSWAGLYPIDFVRADGTTTDIGIATFGACCGPFTDYAGFTYSPSGPPGRGDCDGERKEYQHLDGAWYVFICYW